MLSRVKRNILALVEEAVEPYEIDTNPENFQELVFDYQKLMLQDRENCWARADLACLAAQTYGKLRQLATETGDGYGYLKQLSYCAKQYDKRTRNLFYKLSFAHFRAVAGREDRFVWLQKAQDNAWTVDRLQREVGSRRRGMISIKRIVNTLNEQPRDKFSQLDGMGLINLALGQVGKIKWTGKQFEIEEIYE
jgi:hypothetical protein